MSSKNRSDIGLIDAELAALMLGVTPRRVRQLTNNNQLPNHGTDRKMLYRYDDVYNLAEKRRTTT